MPRGVERWITRLASTTSPPDMFSSFVPSPAFKKFSECSRLWIQQSAEPWDGWSAAVYMGLQQVVSGPYLTLPVVHRYLV